MKQEGPVRKSSFGEICRFFSGKQIRLASYLCKSEKIVLFNRKNQYGQNLLMQFVLIMQISFRSVERSKFGCNMISSGIAIWAVRSPKDIS